MSEIYDNAHTGHERQRIIGRMYALYKQVYPYPACVYHVAALLFLRHISTLWRIKQQGYEELYGVNSDLVAQFMKGGRFHLSPDCTFEHLYRRRRSPDIVYTLYRVLDRVDALNTENLKGIFRNQHLVLKVPKNTREEAACIRKSLNLLGQPLFDITGLDTVQRDIQAGGDFQHLLDKLTSEYASKNPSLFVPPALAALVVKLAAPRAGERLCDPLCGVGTLLATAVPATCGTDGAQTNDVAAYGQSGDETACMLAKINLLMHGLYRVRIQEENALTKPITEKGALMKYEVVISNLIMPHAGR